MTGTPESFGARDAARRVARNAAFLMTATVVARASMFVLGVVMGRGLGVESFGRYGFALALATIIVPVADLGLNSYLVREVARDRDSAEQALPTLLRAKVAFTFVVLVALGVISALLVQEGEFAAVIVIVTAASLVDGFSTFVYAYFQGRERMGLEAKLTSTAALLRAAGGIALVALVGELLPVVIWILAVSGIQASLAWTRLREQALLPAVMRSGERGSVAWRTVLSMGLIALSVMVYLRADAVLIGWIEDERAVGWYTAAYTLLLALQLVPWMTATALVPVFSRSFGSDQRLFLDSWRGGMRAVLLLALPLALAFSLLAGPVIERVYGGEFAEAGDVLAILVWSSPLAALNVIAAGALRGAHRERVLAAVSVVAALGNVAANLVVIPVFGIEGAALVTVTTELAVFLALGAFAVRTGIAPLPHLPYGRVLSALLVLGTVALVARRVTVEVALFSSLLAYVAVLAATRVVSRADVATLGAIVRR